MASICFRCHYCYRVHVSDAAAIGQPLACACGETMIVPDVTTDAETPTDQLPLAEPADGSAKAAGIVSAEESPEEPADARAEPSLASVEADEGTAPETFDDDFDEWAPRDEPPEEILAETADEDLLPPAEPLAGQRAPGDTPAAAFRRGARVGGSPSTRVSEFTAKGKASMGKGYYILAIIVGVVWLVHTSPWIYLGFEGPFLTKPLPEALGLVPHTHYLFIERAFWSAILAGLALSLLGEGYLRRRKAKREFGGELV